MQPKTAVPSTSITSTLDDTFRSGIFLSAGCRCQQLFVADGRRVCPLYKTAGCRRRGRRNGRKEVAVPATAGVVTVDFRELPGVKTWTSGSRSLCRLLLYTRSGGSVAETIPFNVGFRRIGKSRADT